MTEETQKLFSAPWEKSFQDWESYKEITIYDSKKQPVCLTRDKEMSNRLARLPELYDALAEVMYEGCDNCCRAHDPNLGQTFDHFMDEGCPFDQRDCFFGKYWAILRKVRDGK